MLNIIEKVINIPSYTGNFKAINECFEIYKEIYKNINVFIKEITVNGYKSILFSNQDTLNFNTLSICHTDVVKEDKYEMIKKNNIICGRGVFDMKSFVVMNLFNLKEIIEKNYNIKHGVLIVSDEENGDENGTKYWINNLKLNAKTILDNDSGIGNIYKIIKNNLGAITIKLNSKNMFDKLITIENIKNKYKNFLCDIINNEEINLYFNDDVLNNLQKCMYNNTKFNILMLNKYINNNINNKHHILYKNICENILNKKIIYITNNTTNDSRFFSYNKINVISHQATGGDFHKPTEWLNIDSLFTLKNIQLQFLKECVKIS